MTRKKESGPTAAEWGQAQAAKAPPWSDALWRRVCATLNINVATEDKK